MQVEWYGQSAFRLTAEQTVFIDPFGDVSAMAASRGMQFDYPPIEGVEADLVLVRRQSTTTPPERSAAPTRSSSSRWMGSGPATSATRPVLPLRRLGQRELRDEQAAAIGQVDLLFLPVGGGPTIGAEQAAAVCERLEPRWVVPMHYRTPRIGFLETADGFLSRMGTVEHLDAPRFDISELPPDRAPLTVVAAAP